MSITKRRTRAPEVYPHVNPVSLNDFDIDEIREYLRGSGVDAPSDEDFVIPRDDMNRIETLLLCGQRQSAIEELLRAASEHMGRSF